MSRNSSSEETERGEQAHCPYCLEFLGMGKLHICPVACCYIGVIGESFTVVCPYCGNAFDTGSGHVCLELIKLSEPAQ